MSLTFKQIQSWWSFLIILYVLIPLHLMVSWYHSISRLLRSCFLYFLNTFKNYSPFVVLLLLHLFFWGVFCEGGGLSTKRKSSVPHLFLFILILLIQIWAMGTIFSIFWLNSFNLSKFYIVNFILFL